MEKEFGWRETDQEACTRPPVRPCEGPVKGRSGHRADGAGNTGENPVCGN